MRLALRAPATAVRTVVVLLLLRRRLHSRSIDELVAWLGSPRRRQARPDTVEAGVRLADSLLRRWPIAPDGDCLARSLVILHLTSCAGSAARLHCGVRQTGDGLTGHAWCTLDGEVLAGASGAGFTVIASYPR